MLDKAPVANVCSYADAGSSGDVRLGPENDACVVNDGQGLTDIVARRLL